jgi:hypothetical protein
MIEVTSVEVLEDYCLQLLFSSGENRLFDMSPYLQFPVFEKLKNRAFFSLAFIDYGTVVWPCEIDIAPETLYTESIPIKKT